MVLEVCGIRACRVAGGHVFLLSVSVRATGGPGRPGLFPSNAGTSNMFWSSFHQAGGVGEGSRTRMKEAVAAVVEVEEAEDGDEAEEAAANAGSGGSRNRRT